MRILRSIVLVECATALMLAGPSGCKTITQAEITDMFDKVRRELSAAPPDSDEAVILARTLEEAEMLPPKQQADILSKGLKQARKAREFKVSLESPLPEGRSEPSIPGLIRIKTYPSVRSAWVRSSEKRDEQFMVLFRHIKDRQIAMTSPVVMEYSPETSEDPSKLGPAEAMGFLYRRTDQDQPGQFGSVTVDNDQPLQVVSIAVKGAYTKDNFRKALSRLQEWLDAHSERRRGGPPRVLAYHSPFRPFWMKYSEVQIPVEPTELSRPERTPPPLSDEEKRIILEKGTEPPFTGKYWDHFEPGAYLCRQCGAELYRSDSKFRSDCGWPSFDDEIPAAVKRRPDPDGVRTEIICASCGGHLGHVFEGECLTLRNVRHCVNSASLIFRPEEKTATEEAIFAGGCFWGVEHHLQQLDGVISVTSGYTGGRVPNPTYEQVCTGQTGHAEAVRVLFDPRRISYEQLARTFFEIHDPTQLDRQGRDVGTQYRSEVFYLDEQQKQIAEKLISELRSRGYEVVTQVTAVSEFFPAERYHQDYLRKNPGHQTCHVRVRRFGAPAEKQ